MYYLSMRDDTVKVIHGGYKPNCESRIDKHYESYFAVQMMSSGRVSVDISGRRHELEGAWLWTGYPGPRIRFSPLPGKQRWRHRYLAIGGSLPARLLAGGLFPRFPVHVVRLEDSIAVFDELIALAGRVDPWSARMAGNLLERLLLLLGDRRAQPAEPESWFAQLTARMERDPAWDPDYFEISREADIPLSTLRKRFRRIAGVPLHRFLLERRLAMAQRLLREEDAPVAVVAERLGYGDAYFFSRQFRRFVGVTPSDYRASLIP
jgi:AraC-like DNA-binding protein